MTITHPRSTELSIETSAATTVASHRRCTETIADTTVASHGGRQPTPFGPGNAIAELIRSRSAVYGHAPYLTAARGPGQVSFRHLEHRVSSLIAVLGDRGVVADATVGIAITDPLEFAVHFLAIMASGRWVAPLDPTSSPEAIATAVSRLEIALLVSDGGVSDGGPQSASDLHWADVGGDGRRHAPVAIDQALEEGTPSPAGMGGAILSSSGTTGAPKVIPVYQGRLLHTARAVAAHHRLSPADRGFNPLPLFHINAEVVGLLATLVAGANLVLDDRFHRTGFWALMEHHRVTWINAVPAIVSHLAGPDPDEAVPSRIRFIRSASAPLPAATLSRFEANTGIPVLETYGMTEAASQITANPLVGARKPGSVGLPVGIELRITADDISAPTTPGHVEIRGPSVITAYGGNCHRDRFAADGWLRTGDLGTVDADGYLYLVGRTDDVINRGGEKVYPRDIEEAILIDPDLMAAVVVAEDDAVLGQVPVAYLVLQDSVDASDADTVEHVARRVGKHLDATLVRSQRPVALHVVSQLPAGATGKVQRRALRHQRPPTLFSLSCR
ncbi:MAG TPA: AMP-binding protein [Acidimicrobiales bacterium]|jgi:acyl-CoA synthetase (AMP-forming)/AMP-acid ligase II|nr:AMP-binding protein [Acidimicrobiales bacterium]